MTEKCLSCNEPHKHNTYMKKYNNISLISVISLGLLLASSHNISAVNNNDKEVETRVWTITEPATPKTIYEGHLKLRGQSPDGGSIDFNSFYMIRDGKPAIPVFGEFHYSRYPESEWEDEIIKMKAGGITVLPTYIFWILHEEREGEFNWSGNRDLRRFVQLCGKHGLDVLVRIGPFAHGEIRNGGLPDWLFTKNLEVRSNDPLYLSYVNRLYQEIGKQLQGLYYKDGGPIIGCQIENEHQHSAAPWAITYQGEPKDNTAAEYDKRITKIGVMSVDKSQVNTAALGEEHMQTLKRMAQQAGIVTPLYTATGWGFAATLGDEGIPVTAAYTYPFWSRPSMSPFCMFKDLQKNPDYEPVRYDGERYPAFPAEMGVGIQVTYDRRPIVTAEAAEALTLRMLGSGSNGIGYYMYHGGSTPKQIGGVGSLNDEPMGMTKVGYDYQAPLGEFGLEHGSYRYLRTVHSFVNDFQDVLAPMETVLPDNAASMTPDNREDLRYSVRMKDGAGFVFMLNFQDHDPERYDQENLALELKLRKETLRIPAEGSFTLPKDACAVLPFNFDMQGAKLKYATAQLLLKLEEKDCEHYFFFAHDGMTPEYRFDPASIRGARSIFRPEPGLESTFSLRSRSGRQIKVTTLTREQALDAMKYEDKLIITKATVLPEPERIRMLSLGNPEFEYTIYPVYKKGRPVFETIRQSVPEVKPEFELDTHVPRRLEIAFKAAQDTPQVYEYFLRLDYVGDLAMAFLDNTLVLDHFYQGLPWTIGLGRFEEQLKTQKMGFYIRPVQPFAGYLVDLPKTAIPDLSKGAVWDIREVSIVPQYVLELEGM